MKCEMFASYTLNVNSSLKKIDKITVFIFTLNDYKIWKLIKKRIK